MNTTSCLIDSSWYIIHSHGIMSQKAAQIHRKIQNTVFYLMTDGVNYLKHQPWQVWCSPCDDLRSILVVIPDFPGLLNAGLCTPTFLCKSTTLHTIIKWHIPTFNILITILIQGFPMDVKQTGFRILVWINIAYYELAVCH